ncbi:MAG: RCC1 domain-containing protein [Varibaculum cambriense]|uniref:RCC1 domain-containing protein n=1 Tax=Varibaculum cambriense TaxID=184870 RepID=UPI002908B8AF|nr:RCC1 domain-containing protein [Varibaculum cambriense]MDU4944318.1 RCC1 domain-containing protein [Varibaculum cambriense]
MDRIEIYDNGRAEIHTGDDTITVTSPNQAGLRTAAIIKARTLGYKPARQNQLKNLPIKRIAAIALVLVATCTLGAISGWALHGATPTKPAAALKPPEPKIITRTVHSSHLAGANLFTCRAGTDGNGITCTGLNDTGQLGTLTAEITSYEIDELKHKPISIIATGRSTTCAATANSVYCWGKNDTGQATGKASNTPATPTAVLTGKGEITALTIGAAHTCAATKTGLYCWGDTSNGQIKATGQTLTPTKMSLPKNIKDQITALESSGYVTWAQTKTGQLIAFGNNQAKEIPGAEKSAHIEPTEIKGN